MLRHDFSINTLVVKQVWNLDTKREHQLSGVPSVGTSVFLTGFTLDGKNDPTVNTIMWRFRHHLFDCRGTFRRSTTVVKQ